MLHISSCYRGIFYLSITILLFSTFEVVSKFLAPAMQPLQITFYRFLLGGLVLSPFAVYRLKQKNYTLSGSDCFRIGLLGFINIVISMGLIQLGLVYADASASAAVFSSNPLFVVLFARLLLNEKINPKKIAGIVCGLSGIVIIFSDKIGRQGLAFAGLSLVAGAAITFAVYTVLGKVFIRQDGPDALVTTSFSFLAGSLLLVPVILFLRVSFTPDIKSVWPQFIYMSLAVTGIAYVLYFEGLSRLEAGSGSMLYFFKPALASVLSVIFLKEQPGINLIVGIVVIAAGVLIVQFGGQKKASAGRV